MAEPQRLDFTADRSLYWRVPLVFVGEDLSAATAFKLELREYRDKSGSAYITLNKVTTDVEGIRLVYAGTDTVANHVAAGRLPLSIYGTTNALVTPPRNYAPTDNVTLSQLQIKALIDTRIPYPDDKKLGPPVVAAYDLLVYIGGDTLKRAYGNVIIRGAATAP